MEKRKNSVFISSTNQPLNLSENFFSIGGIGIETDAKIFKKDAVKLIIDGYVLPRYEYFKKYGNLSQEEMIFLLFKEKGENITSFIKGIFNIFLFLEDEILILTDHFSIRKLYVFEDNNQLFISNNFKLINGQLKNTVVDKVGILGKALFNRYVNGHTYIKGLRYLPYSSCLSIRNKKIKYKTYWNYKELTRLEKKECNFESIAPYIKQLVKQVSVFLKPEQNVLSLTGGKDSRTLLSALLSLGVKPFTFTYGNKTTSDAHYARKIADGLKLDYEIFSSEINTDNLFKYYNDILCFGDPLINVHRAHRLNAFEKIRQRIGENSCFFGGYLGGEFLMGLYYDNLIFTRLIRQSFNEEKFNLERVVRKELEKSFFKDIDDEIFQELIKELESVSFFKEKTLKMKEFEAIVELGIPHHAQDLNLIMENINYSFPLFIDIDFLYLLFSSQWSMLDANNDTKNPFQRSKLFKFNLMIQHHLFPDLDKYYFAKKGSFNTKEFTKYYYILPLIRAIRKITQQKRFTPAVTYSNIYKEKLLEQLKKIEKNRVVNDLLDVNKAALFLTENNDYKSERHLHKYTNIFAIANQFAENKTILNKDESSH